MTNIKRIIKLFSDILKSIIDFFKESRKMKKEKYEKEKEEIKGIEIDLGNAYNDIDEKYKNKKAPKNAKEISDHLNRRF